jgi:endonuclease/exonuclease/phosphatase family metal-dependent hydrolase
MRRSGLVLLALSASLACARLEAAPPGRLRVLTYNVHGLPSIVTGDDTLARQRAIRPLLEPFDVVGLQEDFMDDGHALLTDEATHPARARFADILEGRVYGAGLAVLSRFRLASVETELYGTFHGLLDAGSDGMASKGFQMARLELAPGVELDVYDSHLDAGRSEGDETARAAQVEQLVASMRGRSADRAVLFLGDTNLGGRSARDQATLTSWLQRTGLTCACQKTPCCGRIDRILVRGGAGVELKVEAWGVAPGFTDAQGAPLSDHEPLEATLAWSRAPL